jgi:hypothetical protein
MAAALAAGALLCGWTASADATPRVTVAVLPKVTTVRELASDGLSPGLMSAGLGQVSAARTFVDISAGNRESPPSDAVPGLLRSTIGRAGLGPSALRTVYVPLTTLPQLESNLGDDDLLIAFAAPPPSRNEGLPIGIAGRGFDGDLTSDSTRTDGYVLSTDIAPTILRRLGLSVPDAMNGQPIRAEGRVDISAIEDRAARMAAIPDRRAPVVITCLAAWILLAFAVNRIVFGLRRVAIAWVALAFAYMPLMLLAGAWLKPSAVAEGLLVGFGAAVLAALTVRFAWGWRGLAIAGAITVIAYAIDALTGSELTKLSLLGPNPIYGARFYGIGNELEALVAVMVPVAVGAGLTAFVGWGKAITRKGAIGAFAGVAAVTAAVFAAGRFGADVGAAIVLPVGAAVAAALLPPRVGALYPSASAGKAPQVVVVVIAAAIAALGALLLIDLVSGANAHLTRSVLHAGGAGNLADIAQRRLELSARDFAQAAGNPLFWLVIAGVCVCLAKWRRIDSWLRPAPLARAGFLGACAAVAVGVLVNDSGATFLVLGSLALGATLAFAWAQAGTNP